MILRGTTETDVRRLFLQSLAIQNESVKEDQWMLEEMIGSEDSTQSSGSDSMPDNDIDRLPIEFDGDGTLYDDILDV